MRALPLLILAFAGTARADLPRVLILPLLAPAKGQEDPNVPVANFVAQSVDETALARSVVWDATDPVFRQAIQEGVIVADAERPDLKRAGEIARKLDCAYVMTVRAVTEKGTVTGEARLLQNGREVWKSEDNFRFDGPTTSDNGARSLANTWATKLSRGPWRRNTPAIIAPTPEVSAGQTPDAPTVQPTFVRALDTPALRARLAALRDAGQYDSAVLAARDGVDEAPLDAERRVLLIEAFRLNGMPDLAAQEARRSVALLPERAELRIAAARAWLAAGRPDEARADLNEAAARQPDGPGVRSMLAEIALLDGKPEVAVEHLDVVLKAGPDGEAAWLRALARALMGDAEGASADLIAADGAKFDGATKTELTLRAVREGTRADHGRLKELLPKAVVNGDSARATQDQLARRAKARNAFLSKASVAAAAGPVRDRLIFVQRLTTQALNDLADYLDGKGDSSLADARIDLGEAMKQLKAAG